jgi:transcriptional regulator with XRE-family HTH domain
MVKAPQLRAVREAKPLSQEELASSSGVSRATISRLELGYDGHPRTIRKLAGALSVDASELMERRTDDD